MSNNKDHQNWRDKLKKLSTNIRSVVDNNLTENSQTVPLIARSSQQQQNNNNNNNNAGSIKARKPGTYNASLQRNQELYDLKVKTVKDMDRPPPLLGTIPKDALLIYNILNSDNLFKDPEFKSTQTQTNNNNNIPTNNQTWFEKLKKSGKYTGNYPWEKK